MIFEKISSAYLLQITREKSCDHVLMIYMKKNEIAYHDSSAKITYSNRAFCENNRVQSKQ